MGVWLESMTKISPVAPVLFDKKTGYWFRGIAIIMVILSHYAEWWSWFTPLTGKAEEFRLALAGLGVFGVNIFFFFSGYGLTKAAGDDRIGVQFIVRRIQSVYLPYFVIVGSIQVLSGGFGPLAGEEAAVNRAERIMPKQ